MAKNLGFDLLNHIHIASNFARGQNSQAPTAAQASLARDLYQHCNHKCGQKIDSITVACKNFELPMVILWTYNATFSPSMSRALPSAVFYGCFAGCHFLALVRCKCVKGLSVVLLALSAEQDFVFWNSKCSVFEQIINETFCIF